jgi:hypothetical protein
VIGITDNIAQRIIKDRAGFFKRNIVFAQIERRLSFVPLKLHRASLSLATEQTLFYSKIKERERKYQKP